MEKNFNSFNEVVSGCRVCRVCRVKGGTDLFSVHLRGGDALLETASVVMQPEKLLTRDIRVAILIGGIKVLLWITKS